MKKIRLKPWMEYVLVFILLLGMKATLGRLFPSDDPEGGNLLVNGVFALLLTAGYIVADRRLRKNRKYKEEVQRRLKNE